MGRHPKSFTIDTLRCRCLPARGHRPEGWYWRIVASGRGGRTLWTGRGTRDEVRARALRLALEGPKEAPVVPELVLGTVADLLDWWDATAQAASKGLNPKRTPRGAYTVTATVRRIKRVIDATTPIDNVSRAWCFAMVDAALAVEAPTTAYTTCATLKAAWRAAHKGTPQLVATPWPGSGCISQIDRKDFRRVKTVGSAVEAERVLTSPAMDAQPEWFRVATRLLIGCGMRPAELAKARIEDLDTTRGMLRLAGKAQNGRIKWREVPITPSILAAIAALREGSDHPLLLGIAFNTFKNAVHGYNPRLRAVCEAAGIRKLTAYSWRYGAVNRLMEAGVSLIVIGQLLGHSPATMLRHYAQATESGLRAATALLG